MLTPVEYEIRHATIPVRDQTSRRREIQDTPPPGKPGQFSGARFAVTHVMRLRPSRKFRASGESVELSQRLVEPAALRRREHDGLAGVVPSQEHAAALVEHKATTRAEIQRVLG